jgi:hypothetical protein
LSGFSAQWLALREPLDAASRSRELGSFLVESLQRSRTQTAQLEVVDLGAGTGANLRYAAPLIGGSQDWRLVERDPLLLAAIVESLHITRGVGFECRVQSVALDLATQLHQLPLRAGTLLTASALLDLVSAAWLERLARHAAEAGAIVWFALTYDGRLDCHPADPKDGEVRELVNRHQLTDKGFGAALGPGAALRVREIFSRHGYQVRGAPSDWCVGPEHPALQHALLEGWCRAAIELAPQRAGALSDWLARRRAHVEGGCSELHVGHMDMVGLPPGRRPQQSA